MRGTVFGLRAVMIGASRPAHIEKHMQAQALVLQLYARVLAHIAPIVGTSFD